MSRPLRAAPEPTDFSDPLVGLIRATGLGDEAAFERLFNEVGSWVFGIVLRVVRDRGQSEEVSQEVFLELWRTAARFDPDKGSARAWVMTMAHRRAVDRVRSAQASTDRDAADASRSFERPHDAVVEEVSIQLNRERVRRPLAELTEEQREAISLAYFKGYTQNEVATALEIPRGTAKTRLRDGLIRLRDAMGVTS